jgi:2'-5' RNA ligase
MRSSYREAIHHARCIQHEEDKGNAQGRQPRSWSAVSFPTGSSWSAWQRDYRFGALVIEPPRQPSSVLDPIRERLDPISAGRVGAHITVTPPFAEAPSTADEDDLASSIRGVAAMTLQLDRPTHLSGSSVIYLPVVRRHAFDRLRAVLLATGLFRLDLPHTSDFVPHLTLSEFGTSPLSSLGTDVPEPEAMSFLVEAISWLVPDEAFHFTVRRTFALGRVQISPDE